ncbi:hypothetical protein BH10PSE7_BH10PSE7_26650 [soil metagenome]
MAIMVGGEGSDYFHSSHGGDKIDGRGGDDGVTLLLTSEKKNLVIDISSGGGGHDIGNGTTLTSIEQLFVYSGTGDVRITGGRLYDDLSGGAGDDVLNGGGGDDILGGSAGSDTLNGGDGRDELDAYTDDVLNGGDGNDLLYLIAYDRTVAFQIDISAGGEGVDIGDGITLASIEYLFVYSGQGNDTVIGGALDDYVAGGGGDDVLSGGSGADQLDGQGGNNIVNGDAGNDSLQSNSTGDTLDGGSGEDTLQLNFFLLATGVTINMDVSDSSADLGKSMTVSNIEHLNFFGGAGNNNVAGGSLADSLFGGIGNDIFKGGAGADYLDGRAGDNKLYAGDGADTLYGGSGANILNGGGGADILHSVSNTDTAHGGAGLDKLEIDRSSVSTKLALNFSKTGIFDVGDGTRVSGIERVEVSGGTAGDAIKGGLGADIIDGTFGNDNLNGGGGDDTLYGGKGQNYLFGSDGDDTLVGTGRNAIDYRSFDTLNGGAGDDFLRGGLRHDEFIGGSGKDTFAFYALLDSSALGARDVIRDFMQADHDQIDLSWIYSISPKHFTTNGGLGAFTNHAAEVRYFHLDGTTIIQMDASGDGVADLSIALTGNYTLTVGDFVF